MIGVGAGDAFLLIGLVTACLALVMARRGDVLGFYSVAALCVVAVVCGVYFGRQGVGVP